jgi:chromosome segregation ATPase
MKRRIYALKEAERIVPLLRSIGRELSTRRRAADELQKNLDSLAAPGRRASRREVWEGTRRQTDLEAELATHLREIHGAEKELERLGCSLDEQHPLRILIPSPNGHWAFDGALDDTRFYATPAGGVA